MKLILKLYKTKDVNSKTFMIWAWVKVSGGLLVITVTLSLVHMCIDQGTGLPLVHVYIPVRKFFYFIIQTYNVWLIIHN